MCGIDAQKCNENLFETLQKERYASKEERHKQIKNWEKVVYVNVNECIH